MEGKETKEVQEGTRRLPLFADLVKSWRAAVKLVTEALAIELDGKESRLT